MSRKDAVAAVVERMLTIPEIGKVYNAAANPVSEADKKARYVVDGKWRAWEVTCEGSEGKDTETATARTYTVAAYGYFSFSNSGDSEPGVQNLCDALEAEFDPVEGRIFGGKFSTSEPVHVAGPKLVVFSGMLLHVVVVTFRITQYPIY